MSILTRTKLPERFMNEGSFRRWLIGFAEGLNHHVTWVESHETSAGVPDLNIAVGGVDIWLELKMFGKNGVSMRPPQKAWHSERYARGGMSWVLACDPDRMLFYLVTGAMASALSKSEVVWRRAGQTVTLDPRFFITVREYTLHALAASKRRTEAEISREAQSALSSSGEDVGSHHWLLGDS